jgi:hypothetical protein
MTEVRCPVCNHLNSSDAEVCAFCGAALAPEAGADPTAPGADRQGSQDSEQDSGLPDWLFRIREGTAQESERPAEAPEENSRPVENPADQKPDVPPAPEIKKNAWSTRLKNDRAAMEEEWMKRLSALQSGTSSPASGEPKSAADAGQEEDDLGWLRQLNQEAPEPPAEEPAAQAAEPEALPDEETEFDLAAFLSTLESAPPSESSSPFQLDWDLPAETEKDESLLGQPSEQFGLTDFLREIDGPDATPASMEENTPEEQDFAALFESLSAGQPQPAVEDDAQTEPTPDDLPIAETAPEVEVPSLEELLVEETDQEELAVASAFADAAEEESESADAVAQNAADDVGEAAAMDAAAMDAEAKDAVAKDAAAVDAEAKDAAAVDAEAKDAVAEDAAQDNTEDTGAEGEGAPFEKPEIEDVTVPWLENTPADQGLFLEEPSSDEPSADDALADDRSADEASADEEFPVVEFPTAPEEEPQALPPALEITGPEPVGDQPLEGPSADEHLSEASSAFAAEDEVPDWMAIFREASAQDSSPEPAQDQESADGSEFHLNREDESLPDWVNSLVEPQFGALVDLPLEPLDEIPQPEDAEASESQPEDEEALAPIEAVSLNDEEPVAPEEQPEVIDLSSDEQEAADATDAGAADAGAADAGAADAGAADAGAADAGAADAGAEDASADDASTDDASTDEALPEEAGADELPDWLREFQNIRSDETPLEEGLSDEASSEEVLSQNDLGETKILPDLFDEAQNPLAVDLPDWLTQEAHGPAQEAESSHSESPAAVDGMDELSSADEFSSAANLEEPEAVSPEMTPAAEPASAESAPVSEQTADVEPLAQENDLAGATFDTTASNTAGVGAESQDAARTNPVEQEQDTRTELDDAAKSITEDELNFISAMDETEISAAAQPEADEALEQADLPDWVREMRPIEAVLPEKLRQGSEDQMVEKSGPLAGLQGILPVEELVLRYHKPPVYSVKLHVSEKQRVQSSLLDTLLLQEPQPLLIRPVRSRKPGILLRVLITVLLLFALTIPLLPGVNMAPVRTPVLYPPELLDMFDTIDQGTTQNAPVLLAFDYEPALSGEMRLSAAAVLDHLMQKNVRLAVISTLPTGSALGEQALRAEQRGFTQYDLSQQMINLGYLAGGTISLAEFARQPQTAAPASSSGSSAWQNNFLEDVHDVQGFSQVIVLTDQAEIGRAWIEQVKPLMGNKPLLVIASAQAAPLLLPYVESGQVSGMVTGLLGGAMYAQRAGQAGAFVNGKLAAYQIGMIVAFVVVLVGALSYGILSIFQRNSKGEE